MHTPVFEVAKICGKPQRLAKGPVADLAMGGCMAEALKAAGATVFCSDIADRGYPLDAIIDFTNGAKPELAFAGIASNPPLGVQGRLTERFIEAGLHHIGGGGFLALLLSADFYSGKRRLRFFRDCPLFAAKIVLTKRLVWLSNPDPDKERPKENHAWFIWQNPPPGSAPLILYAPVILPPPLFLKPRRPAARHQRR
jgi:hypothetical protein